MEIGEAAARMQTTGEQLTLVLKLGEGKRSGIGHEEMLHGAGSDVEGDAWMKESSGQTPEREKKKLYVAVKIILKTIDA